MSRWEFQSDGRSQWQTYVNAGCWLVITKTQQPIDLGSAGTLHEDMYSWRVETLGARDKDGWNYVDTIEQSRVWFSDFNDAVNDFEHAYFREIIHEEPI